MPEPASLAGFRSLEFDLPSALLAQVVATFEAMEMGGLAPANTASVPDAQGVYQLFHANRLVYVGKTDAQAGLRQRLSRHAWTIQGRHDLAVEDMTFKAVQVLVFSAMDLETALINHYRAIERHPAWNGSGFGSNDPGRKRDGTALREDGFDATYPINIDLPLDFAIDPSGMSAAGLLDRLSSAVPFTLRYEKTSSGLEQLRTPMMAVSAGMTVRQIIESLCARLAPGWQATRLPGRVILYREQVDTYPGGEVICRS